MIARRAEPTAPRTAVIVPRAAATVHAAEITAKTSEVIAPHLPRIAPHCRPDLPAGRHHRAACRHSSGGIALGRLRRTRCRSPSRRSDLSRCYAHTLGEARALGSTAVTSDRSCIRRSPAHGQRIQCGLHSEPIEPAAPPRSCVVTPVAMSSTPMYPPALS
jgi:hypothetical protein